MMKGFDLYGKPRTAAFDVALVFVVSVCWRLFTCEYMMLADQDHKWMASKLLLQQGEFAAWTQHTLRWMSTVPLFVINTLFGFHPVLYYPWPILLGSLSAVVVYLLGSKLYNRRAALAFALIFILFPPLISAGSQLEPAANMLPFVLAALYCVLLWNDRQDKALLWWASVCIFLGYGAKVNALIYAVPIGGAILVTGLRTRKPPKGVMRDLLAFSAPLLLLMLLEGFVLYWLSGYPYGRILLEMQGSAADAIRMQGYGDPRFQYDSFSALLLSVGDLLDFNPFYKVSLAGGFICCIFILYSRIASLYLLSACFVWDFLVTTFMVRSISPLIVAQPHVERYYIVVAALGLLIILSASYALVLQNRNAPRARKLVFTGCLLVSLLAVLGREGYWRITRDFEMFLSRKSGIALTMENYAAVHEAALLHKDVAIEIDNACDKNFALTSPRSLTLNGEARVFSYWSYYGELERKPDFTNISRKRFCSKTEPGKLLVFPFQVSEGQDVPILVGYKGGVEYKWTRFRRENYTPPANDVPK